MAEAAFVLPARYRWVGEILHRSGSVLEEEKDGIYSVRLGSSLGQLLNRERVRITFRKKLAVRDGVDLASPGSWFHDQLLRYARMRGRVTVGYLPVKEDVDREKAAALRRTGFLRLGKLLEKRYGTILVFSFRLSYYSDPAEEEIRHVAYDCERGRVDKRPILKQVLRSESKADTADYKAAPRPDIQAAFRAAWEWIQDSVELKVHAIQQNGRSAVSQKIGTVEKYYRQLLAEEKRLLKSRASRRGQEETRDKIDLLKLEWERRVKEETERLQPQVIANLSAVARLGVPLERWSYVVSGGEGAEEEREIWLDMARGEAWEAPAPAARAGNR